MRGKSLALLVLALGCGLVASLGITQVLAKRGEQTPQGDMTPVYICKADIPAGNLAAGDNLKVEQWPKDKVPAGALVRQEDVDGRRARYKIFAGQPILEPMLMTRGEVPIDAQIPKGLRVVAIQVTIEAVLGGLVLPGSRCDLQVFIRADPNLGLTQTISKTILQDIRVFAVNDVTTTESADPKAPQEVKSITAAKTVSLLVTPAQSEVVTLASHLGEIKLIMRSGEDSEQVKTSSVGACEMLGIPMKTTRPIEKPDADIGFNNWLKVVQDALKRNAAQKANAKPDEPARYTMRVRTGSDSTDVLLIASAGSSGQPGDDGAWTATNLPPRGHSGPDLHMTKTVDTGPAAGSDAATLPVVKPAAPAPLPFPKLGGPPPLGG